MSLQVQHRDSVVSVGAKARVSGARVQKVKFGHVVKCMHIYIHKMNLAVHIYIYMLAYMHVYG